jgi:Cu2+-containing amine oxidase
MRDRQTRIATFEIDTRLVWAFDCSTHLIQEMVAMTHSRLRSVLTCWLSLACWLVTSPLAAQSVDHPLDPLSFREYWVVLEVLQAAGHVNADTRFSIVNLREPSKAFVWKWSRGTTIPRQASALVRQGPDTFRSDRRRDGSTPCRMDAAP